MAALIPSASNCCSPCDNSTTTTITLDELIETKVLEMYGAVPLQASTEFEIVSLAAGETTQTTVTVTGAVMGDFAEATMTTGVPGITILAQVTDVDTVTVTFWNTTVDAQVITLGTLLVQVRTPLTI